MSDAPPGQPPPSAPEPPLPSAQALLAFWFGPRPYTAASVQQHARLWFGDPRAPELQAQSDELVRERLGALMTAAEQGRLGAWEAGPRRRLALIVLYDQVSRHLYRGTSRAFARDGQALSLTLTGMQVGADATLDPVERVFFYLPLEHAEQLPIQEESVAAFRRLPGEASPALQPFFARVVEEALRHRDIIVRFGRFPERNRALGRPSTREEAQWLADQRAGRPPADL